MDNKNNRNRFLKRSINKGLLPISYNIKELLIGWIKLDLEKEDFESAQYWLDELTLLCK